MIQSNYYILTGAMGAGKSAVLDRLRSRGHRCVDDPARQILKEQRSIAGSGVPETDAALFNQLMLSRAIYLYRSNSQASSALLFDRGIPDLIAYAELFGIPSSVYERAATTYRYNAAVFFFAGWSEIYTLDDERRMDFESARRFGERVNDIYGRLGYKTIDVPRVSTEERAEFIVDAIGQRLGSFRNA